MPALLIKTMGSMESHEKNSQYEKHQVFQSYSLSQMCLLQKEKLNG